MLRITKTCESIYCSCPCLFTEPSSETKVNKLDLAPRLVDAHDVLRFEVQVDDTLLMDELYAINDLQHVLDDLSLGQFEIFIDNSLKQLAT